MPKTISRILAASLILNGCAGSSRMTQPPPLSLRVSMERTEFLPGEPILVAVTVANESQKTFEHIAYLSVEMGHLGFSLSKDGGAPVRTHSLGAFISFPEGHRLAPGERLCEVIELTYNYWDLQRPFAYRGETFRSPRTFEPGAYSLSTMFHATLQARYDPRKDVRLEANDVRFTVRDTSAIPSSEVPALEALRLSVPWQKYSVNQWNDVSTRHTDSRYILWLASVGSLRQDSVDVASLADECLAQSRPLTAAAILQRTYMRFGDRLNACEAWLGSLERDDGARELACFLRNWHETIVLRRKHGMSED